MALTADQILRVGNSSKTYKAEFAIGGNLCLTQNSSGAQLASASSAGASTGYPVLNIISGSEVHYNPLQDLDNNWWMNAASTSYETVMDFTNIGQQAATVTSTVLEVTSSPQKYTCRFWVYLPTTALSATLCQFIGNVHGPLFIISSTVSAQIVFTAFPAAGGPPTNITSSSIALGAWHFIEINYDSTAPIGRLFIDGVLAASSSSIPSIHSESSQMILGQSGQSEICLLSEFEFCSNFIRNASAYTPPTIITVDANTSLCFHLTDAVGSTSVADSSSNTLNATLSGTPLPILGTYTRALTQSGFVDIPMINLGQSYSVPAKTSFEIRIFLHPFLPTCSNLRVQVSSNGTTWTDVGNFVGLNQLQMLNVVVSGISNFQYIRVMPSNTGSDGFVRIVQVEALTWVDVSQDIYTGKDGQSPPAINITAKSSNTANASPTPSELQITLNNIENKYSNMNSSSPLYGTLCVDGRGSGVRSMIPVRITASGQAPSGDTFSWVSFYGFITSDDNPESSTGIIYSEVNGTAQIICKSIYSLLDKTIDVPIYSGWFMYQALQDVCWRCGIPQQFISCDPIVQMAPYVDLTGSTGTDIVSTVLQAIPFCRAFETFNNLTLGPQINFKNYGRMRMDLDASPYVQFTNTPANTGLGMWGIDPNSNTMYFVTTISSVLNSGSYYNINGLFKWNMNEPFDSGVSLIYTFNTNSGGLAFGSDFLSMPPLIVGNFLYMVIAQISTTDALHVIQINLTTFASTDLGAFVTGGIPFYWDFDGRYIWFAANTGVGLNNISIAVWDTTQAFSTRVVLTSTLSDPSKTFQGLRSINAQYIVYELGGQYFIGKPAGNPYAWSFSTVQVAAGKLWQNNSFGGSQNNATSMSNAVVDAVNSKFYIMDNGPSSNNIWTLYELDIATAYSNPSKVPDTRNSTGLTFTGNKITWIAFSFPYLFFVTADGNIWILNTSSINNLPFLLGSGSSINQENWQYPTQFMEYSQNGLTALLFLYAGNIQHNNTGVAGDTDSLSLSAFIINNQQFPTSPNASFDLNSFVVDMQIADGNPESNRVQIFVAPETLQTSPTNLWTQPAEFGLSFQAGIKTEVQIPIGTSAIRGLGSINKQRYITLQGNNVNDAPGVANTVSLSGNNYTVTFFIIGKTGYLTIDATGKPSLNLTGVTITGYAIQANQSQLARDVTNQISKELYGFREFLLTLNTSLFNDPSMTVDLLLNGSFAKLYCQQLSLPWYPIVYLNEFIGLTNTNKGISAVNFEVIGYTIAGYTTTIQLKQYYAGFNL